MQRLRTIAENACLGTQGPAPGVSDLDQPGAKHTIVEKLAGWFNQISAMEETKTFLSRVATDPFPGTPEATAALLRADYERWGQYVKLAKIEPQ